LNLPADLTTRMVAKALGLTENEFRAARPGLERDRKFPPADPLTGRTCPLAFERWRQLRNAALFPELRSELTSQPGARHAATIDVASRMKGDGAWRG
jgi:hypothetical protein